jgi:hypothetical protein
MISLTRLWTVLSPLAIGGTVGFVITGTEGCTARSGDEPIIDCNCDVPDAATYVLEPGYEDAPKEFPPLVGATFTVNDYDWLKPYDAAAPNVVLRYLDGDAEVTVEFSYEDPREAEEPGAIAGGAGGGGGAEGGGM